MLEKLKQQPLLGLALAITGGYVLAHVITRALDIFYENELGSDPSKAATWLLIAVASFTFCGWIIPRLHRAFGRRPTAPRRWLSAVAFAFLGVFVLGFLTYFVSR